MTITSAACAGEATSPAASAAEIVIVDCSGSMGTPKAKLMEARQATAAAIDALWDGVALRGVRFPRRFAGYDRAQVRAWLSGNAQRLDAGATPVPPDRFGRVMWGYRAEAVDQFAGTLRRSHADRAG